MKKKKTNGLSLKNNLAEKEARVKASQKMLKNEIYHDMMKPYFRAGNNYKDFL